MRRYCRGALNPKKDKIILLANALKCAPEDIADIVVKFDLEGEKKQSDFLSEAGRYAMYLNDEERAAILSLIVLLAKPKIKI